MKRRTLLAVLAVGALFLPACGGASQEAEQSGANLVEQVDRGSKAEAELNLRSLLMAQDQFLADTGGYAGTPEALTPYGYKVPGESKGIDLAMCGTGAVFAARADVLGGAGQVLFTVYVDSASRQVSETPPVGVCNPS